MNCLFTPAKLKFKKTIEATTLNENMVALLEFNNSVTDEKLNNFWNIDSGTPTISSFSKFGIGSFNGGGTISTTSLPIQSIINSDFTIDCWVYFKEENNFHLFLIGIDTSTGFGVYTWEGNFVVNLNGDYTFGTVTLNTWCHIALVRSNNILYLFKNGIKENTISLDNKLTSVGNYLYINKAWGNPNLLNGNGFIDQFRISERARWTSDFTPPSIDDYNINSIQYYEYYDQVVCYSEIQKKENRE